MREEVSLAGQEASYKEAERLNKEEGDCGPAFHLCGMQDSIERCKKNLERLRDLESSAIRAEVIVAERFIEESV